MADQQIWDAAAENLWAGIKQLESGEAQISELPLVLLHNIYLVTSYAYYKQNHSYMRDDIFDGICKHLLANYDEAKKVVRHADKFLDKELLKAGTGFSLECTPIIFEIHLAMMRLEHKDTGRVKHVVPSKTVHAKKPQRGKALF